MSVFLLQALSLLRCLASQLEAVKVLKSNLQCSAQTLKLAKNNALEIFYRFGFSAGTLIAEVDQHFPILFAD